MKSKPSEFLLTLDSHEIYDDNELRMDFAKEVGLEPCWPRHSIKHTEDKIVARGLGGWLDTNNPKTIVAYGYEIAEALAEKLTTSRRHSELSGRGSRFRTAIKELEEAGY